ncbi:hypothetical protein DFH05DRAFT_1463280 [Lentinula detonsa]|uniref:Uncharacterized protein n=1 Tax=Lentinula detonsa TaxID=2804962 RepID=A0A9W8NT07_9AGAR|nr:hypothetical protein DFH05DRAFT_1463280 [Lentinula detonsa]
MNMLESTRVSRAQDRDFPIEPFVNAPDTEIVKTDPKDLGKPQHVSETVIMSDKAVDRDPKLLQVPQADIPTIKRVQSKIGQTGQLLGESQNQMQLSITVQVQYEPCSKQVPSCSSYSNFNSNNVVDSERKSGTPHDCLDDRLNDVHVRRLDVVGKTDFKVQSRNNSPSLSHQWESPSPPRTMPLAADPGKALLKQPSSDQDVLKGGDGDKASEVPNSPSSGSSPLGQAKSGSPKALQTQNVPADVGSVQLLVEAPPGCNNPIILNFQMHNTTHIAYSWNNAQGDVNHTTNNDGSSYVRVTNMYLVLLF